MWLAGTWQGGGWNASPPASPTYHASPRTRCTASPTHHLISNATYHLILMSNVSSSPYNLKASIATPTIPQKNLDFPQIFRNFAQKWPTMSQSGPNMTQNGKKKAQNGPRMTQNGPTIFRKFFWLKRRFRKLVPFYNVWSSHEHTGFLFQLNGINSNPKFWNFVQKWEKRPCLG